MNRPRRGGAVAQEQQGKRRHDDEAAANPEKAGQVARYDAYDGEFQEHQRRFT